MTRLDAAEGWAATHRGVALAVVVTVAVMVRAAYALVAGPVFSDDETSFWAIAGELAAGRGYAYEGVATAWRPPLYTVLLAGLRLLGAGVVEVQLVQAGLGATVPLLLHRAARGLGLGALPALLVAAAAALHPPFVFFAAQVLSENVAVPLFAAAVVVTLEVLRPAPRAIRPGTAVLLGVLWGLAILARPQALVGLLLALAAIVLSAGAGRRATAWRAVALASVATLVLCVPWALRNSAAVGGAVPVVSGQGFTLWVANRLDAPGLKDVFDDRRYLGMEVYAHYGREFPGILPLAAATGFDFERAGEAERDAWFRERFLADLRADPGRFLSRAALKSALILLPAPENAMRGQRTGQAATVVLWLTGTPVVLGGIVGLGLGLRRWDGRWLAATAAVSLAILAAHLPYVRFRAGAVDPLLLLGVGTTAAWLMGRVAGGPERTEP